ncbi:MAG: UDP-N-acetylglucosamine 2-epimerase [Candidatus Omnitrophica bacterium]|nr:UDP-N-acetylglucosamine 2-epimerase [Candidatus Omnitrophota bacterium]
MKEVVMGKKRILVAYANAGAGHVKSALAIEGALRDLKRDDVEVRCIDTLNYSTDFLRRSYPRFYLFMVNKIPTLWGLGYYLFDTRIFYRLVIRPLRRIHNRINCSRLVEFIKDFEPHVAVNTHFLGSEVMADMKRKGLLENTKLISVVTDYFMHSFWVDSDIDYYCVAQEESKAHLTKRGVPAEMIKIFGIPVDKKFSSKAGRQNLCKKLNIPDDYPTVLLTSGGFGVGPVKELVNELAGIKRRMQLLVVCGKNPRLYNEVREMTKSADKPVSVYEFVDNMDELMEVSDVIVTKSGGMSSTEALAKDLPMIVTSAIPGQEARNCRFLVKSGVAFHKSNIKDVGRIIEEILDSGDMLNQMKKKIALVKKPDSARDVADFILNCCPQKE